MSITEMLAWQWQGYISYHQSRVNLVIHWLVVPVFITATFTMLWALIHAEISNAILAACDGNRHVNSRAWSCR